MSEPAPAVTTAELEGHPFLKGLGSVVLRELVAHAGRGSYAPGESIAREGDVAHAFFLIQEGKVGLEIASHDRPHLTILTLGPGDVFGWSWLVAPHRWRVDARALKFTRVLVLEGAELRRTLDRHPAEGYQFLLRFVPILAQRLDATRLQVLDVHSP